MQSSAWVALLHVLRQTPPAAHGSLMLVTTNGQEIAIQDIFRMEPDYLVIRGRLAGTQDAGRVFMIPYRTIQYLAFEKAMKAGEVNAIFGGAPASVEAPPEHVPTAPAPAPEPAPPPAPPAAPRDPRPPPAPEPAAAQEKGKTASRTVLLERVRARLAAAAQAKSAGSS